MGRLDVRPVLVLVLSYLQLGRGYGSYPGGPGHDSPCQTERPARVVVCRADVDDIVHTMPPGNRVDAVRARPAFLVPRQVESAADSRFDDAIAEEFHIRNALIEATPAASRIG